MSSDLKEPLLQSQYEEEKPPQSSEQDQEKQELREQSKFELIAQSVKKLIKPQIIKIDGFPIDAVQQQNNQWVVIDKELKAYQVNTISGTYQKLCDFNGSKSQGRAICAIVNQETAVILDSKNKILLYHFLRDSYESITFQKEITCCKLSISGQLYFISKTITQTQINRLDLPNRQVKAVIDIEGGEQQIFDVGYTGDMLYVPDGKQIINVFSKDGAVINQVKTGYGINCILAEREYLFCGTKSGEILVYTATELKQLSVLKCGEGTINCLNYNQQRKIVVAGCNYGYIHVWDIQNKTKLPYQINAAKRPINFIKLSADASNVFYFCHEFTQFYTIQIPEIPQVYKLQYTYPQQTVKQIKYNQSKRLLMVVYQSYGFEVFRVLEDMQFQQIGAYNQEYDTFADLDKSKDSCIFAYNSNEQRAMMGSVHLKSLDIGSNNITSQSDRWQVQGICVVPGENCFVLYFRDGKILKAYRQQSIWSTLHKFPINALISSNNGKFLISGDNRGFIYKYDNALNDKQGSFQKHSAGITALAISNDDQIVASGSQDGLIRVHNAQKLFCFGDILYYKDPIVKLYITNDTRYLMATNQLGEFTIWDLKSMSRFAQFINVKQFEVTEDEGYIWMIRDQGIVFMENILKTKQLTVFGPNENRLDFLKYIYKIISGYPPDYKSEFDNQIVAPYKYSCLQFYTAYNLFGHISKAITKDCLYVEAEDGLTPLTTSIALGSIKITSLLVDYILKKSLQVPNIGILLEQNLSKLNDLAIKNLSQVYLTLFTFRKSVKLPENCAESVALPIIQPIDTIRDLDPENFMAKEDQCIGQQIVFRQFFVPISVAVGSTESIEFLESISTSENKKFFQQEFIQLFLQWKWEQVRWVMTLQAALYWAYLLFLILHVVFAFDTWTVSVNMLLSNALLIYEIFQVIATRSNYLKDPKNFLDWIRAFLFLGYATIFYLGFDGFYKDLIQILLLIFSFIRGISYFSIFAQTRYMVYLINEVMMDMIAFFAILFYSTLTFAVIFLTLEVQKGDFDQNLVGTLESSYLIGLGEFGTDEYNVAQMVLFYLSTLISTVVMMNLLISIIGDTFGRVSIEQVEADARSLAELILEVENMFYWKRDSGQKVFFSVCKLDQPEMMKKSTTQRIVALSKHLNANTKLSHQILTRMDQIEAQLQENMKINSEILGYIKPKERLPNSDSDDDMQMHSHY